MQQRRTTSKGVTSASDVELVAFDGWLGGFEALMGCGQVEE
jgi:hypothetical protein